MRRFVILDSNGDKLNEGVEVSPGGSVFVFHQHRDRTQDLTGIQSFVDMSEVASTNSGGSIRFVDWHITDEAYKLAAE